MSSAHLAFCREVRLFETEGMLRTNPFRKIRVFVSSICGDKGRFDGMRGRLSSLIESTSFMEAYLFERGGASTQTAPQRCLSEMRDCDVAVFVIDNEKGVTDPVQDEIDCARRLDTRSLYYFVTERSEKRTPLQLELAESGGLRYKNVSRMDDVPNQVVHDLLEDIFCRYREWCNHDVVSRYEQPVESRDRLEVTEYLGLPKSCLSQLPGVRETICAFLFDGRLESEPQPGLDAEATRLARALYLDFSVASFDSSGVVAVARDLLPVDYSNVVEKRWLGIRRYLKGDVEGAVSAMREALSLADDAGLEHWFVDDILVDLRNVSVAAGGMAESMNEYQQRLSSEPHEVVYPLVDRQVTEVFKEMERDRFKEVTGSYGTITYGNSIQLLVDPICRAFAIATVFGSLTHISLTVSRMKSLVLYLSEKYRTVTLHASLLKLSIVDGRHGDGEKTIQAFNDMKFDTDASIAKEVFDFCDRYRCIDGPELPLLEGFAAVGCYLGEVDFAVASARFMQECERQLDNANQWRLAPSSVFPGISANAGRLSIVWMADYCKRAMASGFYFWRREALSFLSRTAVLSELLADGDSDLLAELDLLLRGASQGGDEDAICDVLVASRMAAAEWQHKRIDEVAKRLPEQQREFYLASTGQEGGDAAVVELVRQEINGIAVTNRIASEGGGHPLGDDHHRRAAYLVVEAACPSLELAGSTYDVCLETLVNPNVSSGEKVHACEGMCILLKTFGDELRDRKDTTRSALADKTSLLQGVEIGLETMPLLDVWLDVLGVLVGSEEDGLFTSLGRCYRLDKYAQSRAGDALGYLFGSDGSYVSEALGGYVFSYAYFLARSRHFQLNLRGIRLLTQLLNVDPFKAPTAQALYDSYDGQAPRIKCNIVDVIDSINAVNSALAEGLRGKVLRDSTEPVVRHLRVLDAAKTSSAQR